MENNRKKDKKYYGVSNLNYSFSRSHQNYSTPFNNAKTYLNKTTIFFTLNEIKKKTILSFFTVTTQKKQ